MPKVYSTGQAAKRLGISRQSLITWMNRGWIDPPSLVTTGSVSIRLWTNADIRKARKARAKVGK